MKESKALGSIYVQIVGRPMFDIKGIEKDVGEQVVILFFTEITEDQFNYINSP